MSQIKLAAKNGISKDSKNNFLNIVQQYDAKAKIKDDSNDTIILKVKRNLSDNTLKEITEKWGEFNDNFLIDYDGEEDNEELLKKEELKSMIIDMNKELNILLHNRMVEEKAQKGWKYGHEFSIPAKESPLMKQYHELPEEYKPRTNILRDAISVLENNGFIVTHKKKISK